MRPLGAELFRTDRQAHIQTDGRTDRQSVKTKLMVAFRNFANAHKNRLSAAYVGTLTSGVQEWSDLLSAKDMGW